MPRSRHLGFGHVNLLKKVKIDGEWRFCPAIIESGRRLNDQVRVKGQIETHSEGAYYLEWRENGKRRRQPVRNRALVFEQARLKTLAVEAQRYGRKTPSYSIEPCQTRRACSRKYSCRPVAALGGYFEQFTSRSASHLARY